MTWVFNILLWIWQAPQNLVGLVLLAIYHKDAARLPGLTYKGIRSVIAPTFPGGISLGNFIFVWDDIDRIPDTWDHEWGHTRQSRILGPLYLLVIGLPSIIWAACYKYDPEDPNGYYRFYTEKWADKLGGVKR